MGRSTSGVDLELKQSGAVVLENPSDDADVPASKLAEAPGRAGVVENEVVFMIIGLVVHMAPILLSIDYL